MSDTYNGWRNRATWNVALWVSNDPGLYGLAVEYAESHPNRLKWHSFVEYAGLRDVRTPDGFSFSGTRLDTRALASMLMEFREVSE